MTLRENRVWFLLIDHDHKPFFGDPIYEWVSDGDSIHRLKLRLKTGNNESDFYRAPANRIEILEVHNLEAISQ
jgi:hypothetical protein